MRLSPARVAAVVAIMLTAYVIQSSLLARLGLPGAVPDLVLVVVAGVAMVAGPTAGTIIGFAAGVLLGLAPPGSGPLGQTAAVYAVVGFLAGQVTWTGGVPSRSLVSAVAGLCAASTLAMAVLAALLTGSTFSWSYAAWLSLTTGVYGAVLALGMLPLTASLIRGAPHSDRAIP